jgi:SAM-dependent methyltransferase
LGGSRPDEYGSHLVANMLTRDLGDLCPPQLRPSLARYLAGDTSGEIALMHFVLQLGGGGVLNSTLEKLAAAAPERKELSDLVRLAVANTHHLAQVSSLAEGGLVDLPCAESERIAAIRDQFDKAVAVAPEASVALYSLGSGEILDRATGEIIARLAEWELLRPDLRVLDIGCGIGRIERALAPQVGAITAIDVSPGMILEARQRCRDLANVTFASCNGRELDAFAARSFDLVLAIDSFPYLFAAGPAIAAQHVKDAAQLLRPGGHLAIFNFSYRGDDDADRRDVEQLAGLNGLAVARAGSRDFTLWDGLTFLLALPGRRE